MKTRETLKTRILISNISYIYPVTSTGNILRISIGALSLENQKSDFNDDCHPMICGWNENPAVGFADFQWWLKCRIEASWFIIGKKIIPFSEKLSFLSPVTIHGEPSIFWEFEDATRFRLTVRDESKPIEICEWTNEPNFLKKKIREYGYTDLSD